MLNFHSYVQLPEGKAVCCLFPRKNPADPWSKPLPLEDDLKNKNYWRVRGTWGLLQKYVQITLDCCHCCGPSSGWQSCLEWAKSHWNVPFPCTFTGVASAPPSIRMLDSARPWSIGWWATREAFWELHQFGQSDTARTRTMPLGTFQWWMSCLDRGK